MRFYRRRLAIGHRSCEIFTVRAVAADWCVVDRFDRDGKPLKPTVGYTERSYDTDIRPRDVVAIMPVTREDILYVSLAPTEGFDTPGIHPDVQTAIITKNDVHFVTTPISKAVDGEPAQETTAQPRGIIRGAIAWVASHLPQQQRAPEQIPDVERLIMAASDKIQARAKPEHSVRGAAAFRPSAG